MIRYTTAPDDYDWFGTTTLEVMPHTAKGKPIRKVEIDDGYARWQEGRYASGLHMSVDESEYQKLVDFGLLQRA